MNALTEIKKKEIYKEIVPKWLALFKDFYDLSNMVKSAISTNASANGTEMITKGNKDITEVIPFVASGLERAIDLWYECDIKLTTLKNEEKIEKLKKRQLTSAKDLDDLRNKETKIKHLEEIIRKAERIEAGEEDFEDDENDENEDDD